MQISWFPHKALTHALTAGLPHTSGFKKGPLYHSANIYCALTIAKATHWELWKQKRKGHKLCRKSASWTEWHVRKSLLRERGWAAMEPALCLPATPLEEEAGCGEGREAPKDQVTALALPVKIDLSLSSREE